jgi:peptidoglycan/LPS O-acetylase OafA/YrhL
VGEIKQQQSPGLTPPPGNPRFPLLDGLRGVNVLGVLLAHSAEITGTLGFGIAGRFAEAAGTQAVLTFFAISGFLLYRPYVAARAGDRPAPRLLTYARRRVLRIVPAYWVALTLLAIYPGVIDVFSGDWWRFYGYMQIYADRTNRLGLAVAWTLCVEVTFYLMLPLWASAIGWIGDRVNRVMGERVSVERVSFELPALVALAGFGIVVQCLSAAHHIDALLATTLAGECTWFALGMAFAVVSVQRGGRAHQLRWLPELSWAIAVAAFVGVMALVPGHGLYGLILEQRSPISGRLSLERALLELVMVAGLLLPTAIPGARRAGLPAAVLAFRPLAGLGVISYSFYLYHLPIAGVIWARTSNTFSAAGWDLMAHIHFARTFVLFLTTFVATLVVATASYRLVERPFLLLKEPGSWPRRAAHMLRSR